MESDGILHLAPMDMEVLINDKNEERTIFLKFIGCQEYCISLIKWNLLSISLLLSHIALLRSNLLRARQHTDATAWQHVGGGVNPRPFVIRQISRIVCSLHPTNAPRVRPSATPFSDSC